MKECILKCYINIIISLFLLFLTGQIEFIFPKKVKIGITFPPLVPNVFIDPCLLNNVIMHLLFCYLF